MGEGAKLMLQAYETSANHTVTYCVYFQTVQNISEKYVLVMAMSDISIVTFDWRFNSMLYQFLGVKIPIRIHYEFY